MHFLKSFFIRILFVTSALGQSITINSPTTSMRAPAIPSSSCFPQVPLLIPRSRLHADHLSSTLRTSTRSQPTLLQHFAGLGSIIGQVHISDNTIQNTPVTIPLGSSGCLPVTGFALQCWSEYASDRHTNLACILPTCCCMLRCGVQIYCVAKTTGRGISQCLTLIFSDSRISLSAD